MKYSGKKENDQILLTALPNNNFFAIIVVILYIYNIQQYGSNTAQDNFV
jgi:hypothetical protein